MRSYWKIHRLLLGICAVAALAAFAASPALALRPSGESGGAGACPKSPTGFQEAGNVTASFTNASDVTTYTFKSLEDEHPADGVPGLVKYCVYTDASTPPDQVTVSAIGDNSDLWIARTSKKSGSFSYARPGGNKSNIGLDGTEEAMGTATWGTPPETQKILLHINDAGECHAIYGSEAPETCFVLPKTGPVCNLGAGITGIAYNSIPIDFLKGCDPPPSLAYEANQVAEFGDEVELAGSATNIKSLTVDLESWGCGNSGHWFSGQTEPCDTTPGQRFPIPASGEDAEGVTAHLYEVEPGPVLKQIAEVSNNEEIPYRPSAEPLKCPEVPKAGGEAGGNFFENGKCRSSKSVLMTFNFGGVPVPAGRHVIWTVTFNTTHYGYTPIGTSPIPACPASGCGYDSLNVGVKTYENAPYAGTDVNDEGAWFKEAVESTPTTGPPEEISWPATLLPLAQITTE